MAFGVKICGITNKDDAWAALAAGADYLGMVLYAKSPRAVSALQVCRIRDALPFDARIIAVAVNMKRAELDTLVDDAGLYGVQLHGDEEPAEWKGASYPLWRACSFRDRQWQPDPSAWNFVERFVVDAAVPGVYGGSGTVADWSAARELAGRFNMFLAGGLNPENVGDAVCQVAPAGVDVSGGVEAAPGRKDHAAVREFIRNAKNAGSNAVNNVM